MTDLDEMIEKGREQGKALNEDRPTGHRDEIVVQVLGPGKGKTFSAYLDQPGAVRTMRKNVNLLLDELVDPEQD